MAKLDKDKLLRMIAAKKAAEAEKAAAEELTDELAAKVKEPAAPTVSLADKIKAARASAFLEQKGPDWDAHEKAREEAATKPSVLDSDKLERGVAENLAPAELTPLQKQMQHVAKSIGANKASAAKLKDRPGTAPAENPMIAKIKAARILRDQKAAELEAAKPPAPIPKEPTPIDKAITNYLDDNTPTPEPVLTGATDRYGKAITYNAEQSEFISLATSGKSCVLIGSAGTGKTTCMQGAAEGLISSGLAGILDSDGHKHLPTGTPGVVVIAYTRRAVNNIKKVLPDDLKKNCITAHKLLEYAPVIGEVTDPETGLSKKTMTFEPSRNEFNPLPQSIHTIIVEESSMMSVDLYAQLVQALGHSIQFIFLGDIQQLPPVFGAAILGFKLLSLPVVELTEVYRQALESPIIRLAQRVLSGQPIEPVKNEKTGKMHFPDWDVKGKLKIHPWSKRIKADVAANSLGKFFELALDTGEYLPDEDMILIPFNEACGTLEVNRKIANHLARKGNKTTYEVIAGFNKLYYSEGDKVLYEKEDAEVQEVCINPAYTGTSTQAASKYLDYWGTNQKPGEAANDTESSFDEEFMLGDVGDKDDRVRQASHKITLRLLDTGAVITVNSAAEINSLIHAYALTVHKAQGSEWRKVFFCLHQSHATMLQRELLYTGITRAKEELYLLCEPDSLVKGIKRQRIIGNTLAQKAEYFKGKVAEGYELPVYLSK